MLYFRVGQRGSAFRTPVDQTVAAVNQALFIQIDESPDNSSAAALVQRKSLPLPVAGATQLSHLLLDRAAVFFLPGPSSLQKLFSAQIFLFLAFFLPDPVYDLDLRSYAGVIAARQPQCAVALKTLETDQQILQSLIQRMTHMEFSCDIRRRHHDGKRFFRMIFAGSKSSVRLPFFVNPRLKLFRIICLR